MKQIRALSRGEVTPSALLKMGAVDPFKWRRDWRGWRGYVNLVSNGRLYKVPIRATFTGPVVEIPD